jgi:hypothetical protein
MKTAEEILRNIDTYGARLHLTSDVLKSYRAKLLKSQLNNDFDVMASYKAVKEELI